MEDAEINEVGFLPQEIENHMHMLHNFLTLGTKTSGVFPPSQRLSAFLEAQRSEEMNR